MARVLIAGCGYTGTALGLELTQEGHTVFGLCRCPRLPPILHPIAADLTRPDTLRGIPPALDFVVYTAGASSRNDAAYKAIYVEGPQNLLEVLRAQAQRPRRIVFASSTAVYGQTSGEWVVETSPTEPKDFSGRWLLEGEEVVRTGPFPAIVVRFGGIYGPGRSHLIARVRDGRAVCEPGPPTFLNLIHRDDCVGVLRHLLTMAGPEPMYIAVDHEPADLGTILRWTAQRLGVRLHAGAGAAMLRPRSSNKRCSNARLLHSGYRFRYPMFREGFDAVLAQNP